MTNLKSIDKNGIMTKDTFTMSNRANSIGCLIASNIYMIWNPTYDDCFTAISKMSVIFDNFLNKI